MLNSGKSSIHHYCQLSTTLLMCPSPLLSAFKAPNCSQVQNCSRSTMCLCIALDERWQNGATIFPSTESFPASSGWLLRQGQSIGRDKLKDVLCHFSVSVVGCLQSISTSCRMETTRFCLRNIQMPFHFSLCETFWSLPAEKQKVPQPWVCVSVGTSQLLRAKKYKKVLGSVLGGCNSRWTHSSMLLWALPYCSPKEAWWQICPPSHKWENALLHIACTS